MARSKWLHLSSLVMLLGLGLGSSNRFPAAAKQDKDRRHVPESGGRQYPPIQGPPPGAFCVPGVCIHACPGTNPGMDDPIVIPPGGRRPPGHGCVGGGGGGGGGGDCSGRGSGHGGGDGNGCGYGCGCGCGCGGVGQTLYCTPIDDGGYTGGLTLSIDHGLYNSLANYTHGRGGRAQSLPLKPRPPPRIQNLKQKGSSDHDHVPEQSGGAALAPESG